MADTDCLDTTAFASENLGVRDRTLQTRLDHVERVQNERRDCRSTNARGSMIQCRVRKERRLTLHLFTQL